MKQFKVARAKAIKELAKQGNYTPSERDIAEQILFGYNTTNIAKKIGL